MKKVTLLLPIAVLVMALAVGTRVLAQDGQNDNSAETEATQTATQQANEQAQKLAEQLREAQQKRAEQQQKDAEARTEALQKQSEAVREQEKQAAEKKKEEFQKACETRRENFKTRMESVTESVKTRTKSMNAIVDRIKAFVKNNNLTVPNYAALLAAVQTQSQLAQSISTTVEKEGDGVDCSDSTAAKNSVAAFKDAVGQDVSALQAFKTAVVNLITAVRTAAQGANNAQ